MKDNKDTSIATPAIILNHLITNEIDVIHFLTLYIVMFVIYFYQCTRITNYAKDKNKHINFQILFCIMTLVRISELTYSYLGYEIDQWEQEWKIGNKKLIYCDPSIQYSQQGYCHVRYEINGIFQNINLYFGMITVQMITFYQQKQISPLKFITIYKVTFDQYVPFQIKLFNYFFILMDICMLACQIVVWNLRFEQTAFDILHWFQIIFSGFTALYFIYNIWSQHRNGETQFQHNKLKVISIAVFVLARTGYIILRLLAYDSNKVLEEYKKSIQQFYIILFNQINSLSGLQFS